MLPAPRGTGATPLRDALHATLGDVVAALLDEVGQRELEAPLRHLLADDDLTAAEQREVLDRALALKAAPFSDQALAGPHTVSILFDKPTLRTQVSFVGAVAQLGGHPMVIDGRLAGVGERESVSDVARILGPQSADEWLKRGVRPQWLAQLIDQRRAIEVRVGNETRVSAIEGALTSLTSDMARADGTDERGCRAAAKGVLRTRKLRGSPRTLPER